MEEEKISIQVNIADVAYPLRIKSSEEEAIRMAEKALNERLSALKHEYQINDKQVLLSMASLSLTGELLQLKNIGHSMEINMSTRFKELEMVIDSALKIS